VKAIGYSRVSTAGQVRDGVSLEVQEKKIRLYAELHEAESVEIFTDAGISGKRKAARRPGLKAALDRIGKGDCLVVFSLSRLSRSTCELLFLAEDLKKRGASLVSLSENLSTAGAAGALFFTILAALCNFESDQISERVTAACENQRAKGFKTGGGVPFGFTVEGKRLVPEPAEQLAIRGIRDQRQAGASLRVIARELEAQGVRRKAGGSTWNAQAVKNVLTSKTLEAALAV